MKILITGSNGVIGREIASKLKKNKKNKLILLTNKKKGKNSFFYQDLTKPINIKMKPDVVIHCASKHPFSKVEGGMKNLYLTNVKITKNIINYCNKKNVKKVIFLSAMLAYGLIKTKIVTENQKPLNPNLYGKSKFFSEKLFFDKRNIFKTICLRIPGVFTSDLSKNHPLIINILKKVINNKSIYAYNLNDKFNNITDTNEIVKFINIVLKKRKIKNKVYNFSSSKPMKFIQVINLMKKILNSKSKIISQKKKKNSFIISNKRIKKDFNFASSTTREIITRCCYQTLKQTN